MVFPLPHVQGTTDVILILFGHSFCTAKWIIHVRLLLGVLMWDLACVCLTYD
jgi:hypothetical protein